MSLKIHHSLLISLGILVAAITLLAISSMAASLFIARTLEGQATAINESGSLRMRSYRIASSLVYDLPDDLHWKTTYRLVNEFEQHLKSPNLTGILPADSQHPLRQAYNNIEQQWLQEIRPLFDLYLEGITDNNNGNMDMSISEGAVINLKTRYFMIVADFVDNIDYLVSLLEQDAESKIRLLRMYQFSALGLTILLLLFALYTVYKRIHIPLRQLLLAADHTRKGDFSFRTTYTSDDELGQLGQAFNTMAEDLSKIYSELENRVQQKTHDLERSNYSLELLYKIVKQLNEASTPHSIFDSILRDIEQLTDSARGAICLTSPTKSHATMLATNMDDRFIAQFCHPDHCQKCLDPDNRIISINSGDNPKQNIITIPVSDQNQCFGVLLISPHAHAPIEAWQMQLLESIAGHIGTAISLSQQAAEIRRLALMEERGAIARELHDSLAQSLTFMKIQLSRLQALLNQSNTDPQARIILADLRLGLNSAYKELRELLTTFRLKIDGDDFNDVLSRTVDEFNQRSDANIKLTNQILYSNLSPNEEIHILQIIREALSNAVQHAEAAVIDIILKTTHTGDIQVIIEDDGKGMGVDHTRKHHYGLSIMKERAQTLNGQLDISSSENNGTQIELSFSPENRAMPIHLSESHC